MSSTVVSDRFARDAPELRRKEIVTPEGVPLVFTIARAGDRAVAFLLDALLILLCAVPIGMAGFLGHAAGTGWILAVSLLLFFLLRNGYFIGFELRLQGRTPGKRRLAVRVVDAGGGVLAADQVIVRNLTREVETFLPLIALRSPELVVPTGPGWVQALAVLWLGIFLVLPFLNRDRRRIGDLLAGTMVVRDPRAELRRDLLARIPSRSGEEHELLFTREQLEMYGVYELQVLEELLRKEPARSESLAVVAEKIQRKIGWEGAPGELEPREFLARFYRAQRARLEQDLLLGKARDKKRGGRLGSGSRET